jgi:hypothetical protein
LNINEGRAVIGSAFFLKVVFMFGNLSSLTGGGGLSSSSSSQAGGDNKFDNTFNYKTGGSDAGTNQIIMLGLAAVALVLVLKMGK